MSNYLNENQDLIRFFSNGVNYLQRKDLDNARENFLWCRDQIDDQQCDVHRALAFIDTFQGTAADPTLEAMHQTRRTWGKLLAVAGQATYGQPMAPNTFEARVRVVPELSLSCSYRCPEIAAIGWGVALIEQGRYDEAVAVLDSADRQLPIIGLARMNLYARTHRWADVITLTDDDSLLDPVEYTKDGEPTSKPDSFVAAATNLLAGTAHAHLGNLDAALHFLDQAGQRQFREVNLEVVYLAGLIDRHKGDEAAAVTRFNAGQAFGVSDKLAAAAANPDIRLTLTTAELINQRTSFWDPATQPDLDTVREEERGERQGALLAEAEAELERQIGMAEVKTQVKKRKDNVAFVAEAARRGRPVQGQSLHMAFTGPPGTGKTTIARVVAKIYSGLGILKSEQIVEVGRDDLVGDVIGLTEKKTNAVIDRALDGILFIDEAYALVSTKSENDFGPVAVNTLLARMENERDRLVVIIAGYDQDITQLLAINDGLASRFSYRIRFQSYSPEEIGQIAEVMATGRGSTLASDAQELIVSETRLRMMGSHKSGKPLLDVAGNGRFVRNVIEKAETQRSSRLSSSNLSALTDEELFTLTADDLQQALNETINPLLGITTER